MIYVWNQNVGHLLLPTETDRPQRVKKTKFRNIHTSEQWLKIYTGWMILIHWYPSKQTCRKHLRYKVSEGPSTTGLYRGHEILPTQTMHCLSREILSKPHNTCVLLDPSQMGAVIYGNPCCNLYFTSILRPWRFHTLEITFFILPTKLWINLLKKNKPELTQKQKTLDIVTYTPED